MFIRFILNRDETNNISEPTGESPNKQPENLIVETDIDEICPINLKTPIKVCFDFTIFLYWFVLSFVLKLFF